MLPATLDNDVGLRNAYAKACIELGLGPDDVSRGRRDQLATLMIALSMGGESDAEVIRIHAVHRMQPPAAGSFFSRG